MDMVADDFAERVKAIVWPVSAILLFVGYPILILVWTIIEGRAAQAADKESSSKVHSKTCQEPSDCFSFVKPIAIKTDALPKGAGAFGKPTPTMPLMRRMKTAALPSRRASTITVVCAVLGIAAILNA